MLSNGRKTIGLFIFQAVEHFQKSLCWGIEARSIALGYNVVVFSSFGDFAKNKAFASGEEIFAELPEYEKLDGIILALDTFDMTHMQDKILEILKEKYKGPIVSVRKQADVDYNILVDETTAMDGLLRHFIEDHGFQDICFLTGTKGHVDAEARLSNYLKIMEEYNLFVDESMYCYGDFWKWKGKEACDYFIDKRGKMPDAIVCANDYMGIAVCHELVERGIRVPEDIAVCGYDGIWETEICAPTLTTASMDFSEMGSKAVELIHTRAEKSTILFQPKLDLRESCCKKDHNRGEELQNRKEFYKRFEMEAQQGIITKFFSMELESIDSMRELSRYVKQYFTILDGCEEFYICIQQEALRKKQGIPYGKPMSDNMKMVVGARRDGKQIPEGVVFERKQLLPQEVLGVEPLILYVIPFHYKEMNLGYAVTRMNMEHGGGYPAIYQEWIVNLENAVYDMFNRKKMEKMINRLEELSIRDQMTGVYNRYGFEREGKSLFEREKKRNKYIYMFSIDLDGLKEINDHWGHGAGDLAICTVSDCLKEANTQGAIVARMGGDEFSVVGACLNKDVIEKFISHFKQLLKREDAKYEYTICASLGEYIREPGSDMTWDECIRISDNLMYVRKKEQKEAMKK